MYPPPEESRFPWLALFLFLATIVTTLMAGAWMKLGSMPGSWQEIVAAGWPFSVPLLLALGTHEMGHFIVARMHGLRPSWPYFIPAPTFLGTFGAVIRMRFVFPPTRKQLFDVGIAGPIAGFVVSVYFLYLGASWSEVDVRGAELATYTLAEAVWHWWQTGSGALFEKALGGPFLVLGDSLLVRGVLYWVTDHPAEVISLHPVAFAGWVGLFVTTLNLMPVGQLDGGHVAYALLGKHFRWMPWVVIPILLVLGFLGWPGWFVWALLLGFLGTRHPPAGGEPLGRGRMALAWCCLVIFVLIFTPVPIQPAW
jgi:membrane-associated protease RseP (regulator of RpoE activity)